jgi:hypothetical protein
MFRLLKLAAAAAMLVSGAANATTFDFSANTTNGGPLVFLEGALSVTVDGFRLGQNGTDNFIPFGTADRDNGDLNTVAGQGIGFGRSGDGPTDVDGTNGTSGSNNSANEFILFTFDSLVNITAITFFDDDNDEFRLFGDTSFVESNNGFGTIFGDDLGSFGTNNGLFTVNPSIDGVTSFGVAAFANDSSFRIQSVTISAVPEPATWLMMILGFGLVGLTLQRRRKLATA